LNSRIRSNPGYHAFRLKQRKTRASETIELPDGRVCQPPGWKNQISNEQIFVGKNRLPSKKTTTGRFYGPNSMKSPFNNKAGMWKRKKEESATTPV
jgi:hypothetical protein